ncbi:MAG: phosphoribosyltransferase domain-containing protein, partial [Sporichthyaceae bacterium]|nr:phosphoribosyltransferase domain-containing protein [Sporichthyaceae bacterium]
PLSTALNGDLLGGQVLLVDDIYGTGATVDALRPALASHLAPTTLVRTVVLCRNVGATTDPDLWLWTVDDWVRFPWEPVPPGTSVVEDLPVPAVVQPT